MELRGRSIEILKTFSKLELKELSQFLYSPYHNSGSRLTGLFEILVSYHPSFDQIDFTDEIIYKKVFKSDKYSYQILKNLLSDLYKKLSEFLILKGISEDKRIGELYLLKELSKRMAESSFRFELNKAKKAMSRRGIISNSDFLSNAELADLESTYMIIEQQVEKSSELKAYECKNYIEHFISALSSAYSTILFNNFNYNIVESSELINNFLSSFDIDKFEKLLTNQKERSHFTEHKLRFLKLCRDQFKTNGKEASEIHKDLMQNIHKYDDRLKFGLLKEVQTFFLAQINTGDLGNVCELRDSIKYMLENDLLKDPTEKYIEAENFLTLSKAILLSRDHKFSLEFIEKAKLLLPDEKRSDYLNYSLAYHYLKIQYYEKAIEHLSKIKQVAFVEKFYVKGILLVCFYELSYYDQVFSAAASYRKFLCRNRNIKDVHREHNLVFLSFLEKLAGYKLSHATGKKIDVFELESLRMEIEKAERVNSRKFLLEKVDELKK